MARQRGIIKLEGSVGNLSFYRSPHGYLVREKGGFDGQSIATDPAYQRTRENGWEFGRSARAVKLLRSALRPLIEGIGDGGMTARLMRIMVQVVKADVLSARGQRNVLDGDLGLLQGFEFNEGASLERSLFLPVTANINGFAGTLEVGLPAFVPAVDLVRPQGATHCRFVSAGVEIDFVQGTYEADIQQSNQIALGRQQEAALTLMSKVTANSEHPLLLVFGVEYLQWVNGGFYPLAKGAFHSLRVVRVER